MVQCYLRNEQRHGKKCSGHLLNNDCTLIFRICAKKVPQVFISYSLVGSADAFCASITFSLFSFILNLLELLQFNNLCRFPIATFALPLDLYEMMGMHGMHGPYCDVIPSQYGKNAKTAPTPELTQLFLSGLVAVKTIYNVNHSGGQR